MLPWSGCMLLLLVSANVVPSSSILVTLRQYQSQSYLTTDGQSASLSWYQTPIWNPWPTVLYTSMETSLDSRGFAIMWRPLWREDKAVIYRCCWASPEQSFSGLRPVWLITIFYSINFISPQTLRSTSAYLFPQEYGDPVIAIGTGVPLRPFLRFVALRWRHSQSVLSLVLTT
jgi:hypothetical protein